MSGIDHRGLGGEDSGLRAIEREGPGENHDFHRHSCLDRYTFHLPLHHFYCLFKSFFDHFFDHSFLILIFFHFSIILTPVFSS